MMEYPRAELGHKTENVRQRATAKAVICDSLSLRLDIQCSSDARYGPDSSLQFNRPMGRHRRDKGGRGTMSKGATSTPATNQIIGWRKRAKRLRTSTGVSWFDRAPRGLTDASDRQRAS